MNINMSKEEFEKIKKHKIGQGREGKIYRGKNGLLYKLYYNLPLIKKEEERSVKIREYEIDAEGVKKVKPTDKKIEIHSLASTRPFTLDKEGVKKIYSNEQINAAVKRQRYVKGSSLPLGSFYIDNNFSGVVLKEHKGYINFHTIMILPHQLRIKLLHKVLEKLKELCDNNIYPVDFAYPTEGKHSHSNIMVNLKGDVQFIDLEGVSTVYTQSHNKHFMSYAYSEFYNLFLLIMYEKMLPKNSEEEDVEAFEYNLASDGFNQSYIDYVRNYSKLNYDVLNDMLDNYQKKPKCKTR